MNPASQKTDAGKKNWQVDKNCVRNKKLHLRIAEHLQNQKKSKASKRNRHNHLYVYLAKVNRPVMIAAIQLVSPIDIERQRRQRYIQNQQGY